MKTFILFLFLILSFNACGQYKRDRIILGRPYAEQELRESLNDSSLHNVIDHKTSIIKDSTVAISVAESVLFSIYGKESIIKQRPYEIYFINNYWILIGTLPEGSLGGTFLIIIDSRDSRIIRLTHGK